MKTRHRLPRSMYVPLIGILAVTIGSLALIPRLAAGDDEPRLIFAETRPDGAPVPLTAEQCVIAGKMIEASSQRLGDEMQSNGDAVARDAMNRQVRKSQDWVSQGCPAHSLLGFYPDASGKGGSLRLLEQQSFSADGVITWQTP